MRREESWFLSVAERGNPATKLDRRRGNGAAFTAHNAVRVLVHGKEYFSRLHAELTGLEADDWVCFTDWRGDPDERLVGPGTEVATVLASLAARGVHVRGLVWRSHPDAMRFSEQENLRLIARRAGASPGDRGAAPRRRRCRPGRRRRRDRQTETFGCRARRPAGGWARRAASAGTDVEPVHWSARWWALPTHRALFDPDGRPRNPRRAKRF